MAQLNFEQRLQVANQKGYSSFDTRIVLDMIFVKTIFDVFAHVLDECPVNSCFEWACLPYKI